MIISNETNIKASGQAHIIKNDAEALEVAKQFAEQFKTAVERDANEFYRIPKSEPPGLWALKQYAEVSSHTS